MGDRNTGTNYDDVAMDVDTDEISPMAYNSSFNTNSPVNHIYDTIVLTTPGNDEPTASPINNNYDSFHFPLGNHYEKMGDPLSGRDTFHHDTTSHYGVLTLSPSGEYDTVTNIRVASGKSHPADNTYDFVEILLQHQTSANNAYGKVTDKRDLEGNPVKPTNSDYDSVSASLLSGRSTNNTGHHTHDTATLPPPTELTHQRERSRRQIEAKAYGGLSDPGDRVTRREKMKAKPPKLGEPPKKYQKNKLPLALQKARQKVKEALDSAGTFLRRPEKSGPRNH